MPLIVIVGATGTGKSELSLDLAEGLAASGAPAEIINADAMQLYRGMDIGTAKLAEDERRGIPHHLIDVLDPAEETSVANYQAAARAAIEDVEERGLVPIIVGGSGLYVSSVIQDFRFPGTDVEVRSRLEAELEVYGAAELHRRLALRDPHAAEAIGPHNGRRIVRALEVIEITGEEFGSGLPENSTPWREHITVALRAPREKLVARLDERVRRMWTAGMLDEAADLRKGGLGVTASRAIGYAQAFAQLAGEIDEADAIEQTATLTRRYARRQVSWFRRYRDAHWVEFDDPSRSAAALRLAMGEN